MGTYTLRGLTDQEKSYEKDIPGDEWFDAEVVEVGERVLPFTDKDGNELRNMEFKFKIVGGDFDGRWIRGETRLDFKKSQRSQMLDWVQELFQQELNEGFVLDTDMLAGKRCRVHTFQKPYNDKETGEPKKITLVNDVVRPTGGSAPQSLPSNSNQDVEEPF